MNKIKKVLALLAALAVAALMSACTSSGNDSNKGDNADQRVAANKNFDPPKITHFLDYHNFVKSQELYDNPTTIQWCTFTWGNANSPLVTVPIAGKLTSSSVSLRPTTQSKEYSNGGTYYPELPSNDDMYHGSPPPYRYGFTPGGQYVDFFNMPTFCTTALTEFQRQTTKVVVSNDPSMTAVQQQARDALAKCNADLKARTGPSVNCDEAQRILQQGLGG